MQNICEREWEAVIHIESRMVHAMVGGIVKSEQRNTYSAMVKDTTYSHDRHVENKAANMQRHYKGGRIQDTVVSKSFYWMDIHVVKRLGESVEMVDFVKALVKPRKVHHSMPIIFNNTLP